MKTYSIAAGYASDILIPRNGIERDLFTDKIGEDGIYFSTNDGKVAKATFVSVWVNTDGMFDDELQMICQRFFGLDFGYIRSVWVARLGNVEDIWYHIKLA